MTGTVTTEGSAKRALYDEIYEQLAALFEGETDPVANAANTSALLF